MKKMFRAAVIAASITSTAIAAHADPVSVPERLLGDLQTDLELSDFQAAGIVGNLARETGNFRFLRELNPLVNGSRGGIGYSQWTGPRHDAFLSFVGDGDPMGYEANYAFLLEELEGPYSRVLERLYETDTLGEATEVFMRGYLAPHPKYRHLEERIAFAESYLVGDFAGAGCASTHSTYVSGSIEVVGACLDGLGSIRPVARPEWMETIYESDQDGQSARMDRIESESGAFSIHEIAVHDPFAAMAPTVQDRPDLT
jgi:opacity protein-like surface antigen